MSIDVEGPDQDLPVPVPEPRSPGLPLPSRREAMAGFAAFFASLTVADTALAGSEMEQGPPGEEAILKEKLLKAEAACREKKGELDEHIAYQARIEWELKILVDKAEGGLDKEDQKRWSQLVPLVRKASEKTVRILRELGPIEERFIAAKKAYEAFAKKK